MVNRLSRSRMVSAALLLMTGLASTPMVSAAAPGRAEVRARTTAPAPRGARTTATEAQGAVEDALAPMPTGRPGRRIRPGSTPTTVPDALLPPPGMAASSGPGGLSDAQLRSAAAMLKIQEGPLREGLRGLDLLYARQYGEAREVFRCLEVDFPDLAIGPFGALLMAQAQMGENLDFYQEQAFQRALAETIRRTDAALEKDVAPAWNRFIRAGARGMSGILLYRKDHMMAAFKEGWLGMRDLEAVRKLEPGFSDPLLGVGIYNYWRSALSQQYWFLRGFKDRRQEGLAQLEQARDRGIFTPTLARLALAFTHAQGNHFGEALKSTRELYARYPDNIINLELMGELEARMHNYERSKACFQRITEIDPRNIHVYYSLGVLELTRGSDARQARDYLQRYLEAKLENSYQAPARVRLGDAWWLLGDEKRAMQSWTMAVKTDPDLRMAQARLKGYRPRLHGTRVELRPRRSAAPAGASSSR